jgi:hypothetical protein
MSYELADANKLIIHNFFSPFIWCSQKYVLHLRR